MKRAPQAPSPPVTAASGEILQLKVWLMNISPMVWRRLLVPVDCTLRELHGLLQVAMGWQGFHRYCQLVEVRPRDGHRRRVGQPHTAVMRIPPIADTHSKLIADGVPWDHGHRQ